MSGEVWNVRHETHDLPITAVSFDSDTGETAIVVVNDAQSRLSVAKAIKALRKRRRQLVLIPNLHLLTEAMRRWVADSPLAVTAVSVLVAGGGAGLALPSLPSHPQHPPAVSASPSREMPPLAIVGRATPTPRPVRPSTPRPTSTGVKRATTSSPAPAAGGEAAAGEPDPTPKAPLKTPSPRPTRQEPPPTSPPAPKRTSMPRPSESPISLPAVPRESTLLDVELPVPMLPQIPGVPLEIGL